MKCVIFSEEKVIDFGKKCLSDLRDFVNDEYFLTFNAVKRLRTLYFMTCQMIFSEQIKSKDNFYTFNNIMKYKKEEKEIIFNNAWHEDKEKEIIFNNAWHEDKEKEIIFNKVWNEEIQEKFKEVSMIVEKSKKGDEESEVEEIFKTPVDEKYSKMEFSLEETERIFNLVKHGLDRCNEINENLYYQIKYFKHLYYVYTINYI